MIVSRFVSELSINFLYHVATGSAPVSTHQWRIVVVIDIIQHRYHSNFSFTFDANKL